MSLTMPKANPPSADINQLVRELRVLCGLTQEQFAAKLGVTLVTVNRWENDRAKPMPLALRQLNALTIEMSQFGSEADRETAHRLLKQYFPKNF
ncbi:DNA-binding transcriptional regulator [Trichocoleus sp. FACHB-262]|uniref:helix-turn-helix domain-containing protein n=1 Tax=Trichocoleus sp. FACHB-262 TaxID=2692869 RepID=UPI001F559741|nr:helix-turn-helix transcriptional regulator [Trichocoleus sp. FACHB-262]